MCVLVTKSCMTLCDPMDCILPGSSLHGILQATVLEWVAISFSRGSFQPRDQTRVSCTVGRFLPSEPSIEGATYHYDTIREPKELSKRH